MLIRNSLSLAAALLALTSCAGVTVKVPKEDVQLARKDLGEGGSVVFRLLPGSESAPAIHRVTTTEREKSTVNLVVASVTADLAKDLAVAPWEGVFVERVGEGSSAAKAGLVEGDVILSMNGKPLVSKQQFEELLAPVLAPGAPLTFQLSRAGGGEGEAKGRVALALEVVPDSKKVTETKTDSFPLETSKGVQELTGLQVATVPPDLASEIYAVAAPLTVVSGVVTGSPAYHAGFRCGDRVLSVDGDTDVSLARVRDGVRARAAALKLPADVVELPDAAQAAPTQPAAADGDMNLSVLGPLGSHSASLPVRAGAMDSSRFFFPILFEYESSVDQTSWSLLDFIFQFGANYSSHFLRAAGRAPAEQTELSLFPLGMFEFETSPTENRYRFFWLIQWSTWN
ncbi:MAG: PDZ domain-containing protein [Planctomycetes bacterium]|nr:PDZ domain-containing protein [Planctomycetota bacterium]